ncbi:MAG TPA: geopeptide radical SAM maturase [Geobacteraceae bacterium]
MHLSRYCKIFPAPDRPNHRLLYSTRRGGLLLVPETLLAAIETGALQAAEQDTLACRGLLVADAAAEREEVRSRFAVLNERRSTFSAMVVLNLDCNLACPYCFEGNLKGKRYLSAPTADLLVERIRERYLPGKQRILLDFYGGEPLLSLERLESIATRVAVAVLQQGKEAIFNVITNGTLLTRPVAERLAALGIRSAKVTLDGPAEFHDQSRPFLSGAGSFAVILANLRACCDLLAIQIGGNYTKDTFREFPRLLDHLLSAGLTPDKVQMVKFAPVTRVAGHGAPPEFTGGCDRTSEPWLLEADLFLREEILMRGYKTPKPARASCMIEFSDDLVINYDGSLYKCPAFIGCEGYRIGTLEAGLGGDYHALYNTGVWQTEECLDCAYLPLCFGGCRFLTFLRNGAIDGVDCWKAYLDANLETLLRQDLRYRPRAGGS